MTKVSKYVLSSFFQSFFSLFSVLFFLVSIITFIRISSYTLIFSISFGDLLEMYLYVLPEIITYVLPVTFFISLTLAIFRMSKENETIVLFAMSLSPKKISRLFFYFSLLVAIFLFANSLFFMPMSKQLASNFLEHKKLEAKVNIKSSEFGQKFSSWNVFVNRIDDQKRYEDIVLYERDKESGKDTIVLANNAIVEKNNSILELKLHGGSVYILKDDTLKQIDYEDLKISYKPEPMEIKTGAVWDYWAKAPTSKKIARNFSLAILLPLLPLATYMFAISFGIANLRHESPNIYLKMFVVIILYYSISYQVASKIPFTGTWFVFAGFFIASMVYFHKKVLTRY